MPTITFDGPNKTITIGYDGAITSVDAADIYSRWKDWVLLGNAQFQPAFAESVGGNALGGGTSLSAYYFLNNDLGWSLQHSPNDYQILISGDLYPSDPNTPFIDPVMDAYSVTWILQRSAASYVTSVGGSIPTAGEIADAVWDEPVSARTDTTSLGGMLRMLGILGRNKTITDPIAGTMTVYADDGVTVAFTAPLWEDAAATQPYRGQGAERKERLV